MLTFIESDKGKKANSEQMDDMLDKLSKIYSDVKKENEANKLTQMEEEDKQSKITTGLQLADEITRQLDEFSKISVDENDINTFNENRLKKDSITNLAESKTDMEMRLLIEEVTSQIKNVTQTMKDNETTHKNAFDTGPWNSKDN